MESNSTVINNSSKLKNNNYPTHLIQNNQNLNVQQTNNDQTQLYNNNHTQLIMETRQVGGAVSNNNKNLQKILAAYQSQGSIQSISNSAAANNRNNIYGAELEENTFAKKQSIKKANAKTTHETQIQQNSKEKIAINHKLANQQSENSSSNCLNANNDNFKINDQQQVQNIEESSSAVLISGKGGSNHLNSHQQQQQQENVKNINQNSKAAGMQSMFQHPQNSQLINQNGGNSIAVTGLMNRRPKINDHKIKLIEKVIKRQNLTAQQDSRQHHMASLLHHENSTDSISGHPQIINGDEQQQYLKQRTNDRQSLQQHSKSPQLIIKNNNTSINHYNSTTQGMSPGQRQQLLPAGTSLNSKFEEADEMALNMGEPSGSNYINERVEKTLQKYSKKDIIKGGAQVVSIGKMHGGSTRNGGLYQNSSQIVQGGGSINQVSKIYNSTFKAGSGAIERTVNFSNNKQGIASQSNSIQNIPNNQQHSQFQSPYLNDASSGATIYNQKHTQKLFQGRLIQQQQALQNPLNIDQLDQFRQVNSYSVDRVTNHTAGNSAAKIQSSNQQFTRNFMNDQQLGGSAEKKEFTDLSFDSLSNANNSFTLGEQILIQQQNIKSQNVNHDNESSNSVIQDYSAYSKQSASNLNNNLHSLKIKQQFQKRNNQDNNNIGGVSTVPTSSFSHSNSKHKPNHFEESTPQQIKQSQSSLNYHQLIQQSPIQQPIFNSGAIRQQQVYGYNNVNGFQDLFFDENQSTNDSGGLPPPTANSGANGQNNSNQQLWSQQMLLQHQQQHIQIKQVLSSKLENGNNAQATIPGGVYTLTSNSNQKLQMSPMQYLPQMQYSKSRDGGYRNIPTRDLSSISDQSPQSNNNQNSVLMKGENQHPNQGVVFDEHPFKRPKLHLFKKDASRRIKTSSATRNLQPIYPLEGVGGGVFANSKLFSNNFNSIHIGGIGGTTTSSNPPGILHPSNPNHEPQIYYNSNYYSKNLINNNVNNSSYQNHAFTSSNNALSNQVFVTSDQENLPFKLTNVGGIPQTNQQQSQFQIRKLNPFSNNHFASNISDSGPTTIDVNFIHDDSNSEQPHLLMPRLSALSSIPDPEILNLKIKQSILNQNKQESVSDKNQAFERKNQVSIQKGGSKVQSQKDLLNSQSSSSVVQGSLKNLQTQQDANNGFKHSFYVDKEQNSNAQITEEKEAQMITVEVGGGNINNAEANRQSNELSIDYLKKQGVMMKEGGTIAIEKDGVKHIFVINVNAASHTQSIQESKAMTPCFLHTPNMTNKWNDFKPGIENNEQIASSKKLQQSQLIHHQANPSNQSELSKKSQDDEPEQPLFIRSRVGVPEIMINGSDIKELQFQPKKPMTSHQSSKGGAGKKQALHILQKGQPGDNNQSNNNNSSMIKLCPQDIYLQSSAITTGTTKGSQNSQSSLGHNAQFQKPSTSGSSFRRPLSRNHPMLNIVSKNATDSGLGQAPINMLQQQQQRGTTAASSGTNGVNILGLNQRFQSKTINGNSSNLQQSSNQNSNTQKNQKNSSSMIPSIVTNSISLNIDAPQTVMQQQ